VVLMGVCVIIAVLLLGDAAVRAGVATALLLAPWVLLVLWGVYVVAVASTVRVRPDGVFVQNLLRTTFAPWGRVQRIDMRWQIEITLDDGAVLTCFGGPAVRRPQRLGPGRTKEDGNAAADDIVASLRKAKATAVEQSPTAPVRRGWDARALVILVVIVAWAVAAVLFTQG